MSEQGYVPIIDTEISEEEPPDDIPFTIFRRVRRWGNLPTELIERLCPRNRQNVDVSDLRHYVGISLFSSYIPVL
jgi:hypothetical protein